MNLLLLYFFTSCLLANAINIPDDSLILQRECDSGFVWIEDVPSCCGAPAEHCFFESDLNILQQMIDNSSETINMLHDNNEDGELQTLELGFTEWYNGRLIALDCYLSNIMKVILHEYQ